MRTGFVTEETWQEGVGFGVGVEVGVEVGFDVGFDVGDPVGVEEGFGPGSDSLFDWFKVDFGVRLKPVSLQPMRASALPIASI